VKLTAHLHLMPRLLYRHPTCVCLMNSITTCRGAQNYPRSSLSQCHTVSRYTCQLNFIYNQQKYGLHCADFQGTRKFQRAMCGGDLSHWISPKSAGTHNIESKVEIYLYPEVQCDSPSRFTHNARLLAKFCEENSYT
jgi:hypothetical protein